jgi:hyperosmotically inducible periplasmic protein
MKLNKLFRIAVFSAATMLAGAAAAQDRPASAAVKDAWITTQVQAKYFGDATVKGRNIDVDTTNGVVTLTGEVTSQTERQRAVARAKEVDGVSRVVDRLSLVPAAKGTTGTHAGDKADAAKDKADAKADRAKDKADDKADRAKDKADDKIDRTKDKSDKVADKSQDRADRVGNEMSDAWITTKLQSKYYLDSDVRGLQIDVTTNGGVVTLTGKVTSAAERSKALSLAKSTDGVKQVIDKLTLGR